MHVMHIRDHAMPWHAPDPPLTVKVAPVTACPMRIELRSFASQAPVIWTSTSSGATVTTAMTVPRVSATSYTRAV